MRTATFTILLLGITLASAATITWTGAQGNSLWSFASNWQGNVIPTANDDVVINAVGGVTVTISQPSFANSITIGTSAYPQTLSVLSSLAVGSGGIQILSKGTLQLQGNNDLPLTTKGNVTAQSGGAIVFNSGDITGPGSFIIQSGATIVFSGSALKLIDGTDLFIYGSATIQPTTIQLTNGAMIHNQGELLAVGQINIFYNDKSATAFYNYGNFSYQGTSTSTLTFQVPTFFTSDIWIQAGNVVLNEQFTSSGAISVPAGSSIIVNSGPSQKVFGAITGSGAFTSQGLAHVTGGLNVGIVVITNSGILVLSSNSSTKSLTVGGTLVLNATVTFTAGDTSVQAGSISGAGKLSVYGSFEVTGSNGDTNNFISTTVDISGNGYTTGPISVLFSGMGALNILPTGGFKVASTTSFLKQSGSPVVNNLGGLSIVLNSGGTFYSNVDHSGNGTINVISGLATFEADKFTNGPISIGANSKINLKAALVNAGSVSGLGALNFTAVPSPISVLGDVSSSYFGVPNGLVQVNSVTSDTLELFNGELHLKSASANKATDFNWYGGALRGGATLTSASVLIQGNVAQILDGVAIDTDKLVIRTGTNGMLTTINGGQIVAGN